jgi:hypothetical protein
MLANNPKIKTPGTVPYLGSKLNVDWRSFAILVVAIIVCDSLASVLGLTAIWKSPKSESGQWIELQCEDSECGGKDERWKGTARTGREESRSV